MTGRWSSPCTVHGGDHRRVRDRPRPGPVASETGAAIQGLGPTRRYSERVSEDDAGPVPPEREHDEPNEEPGSVGLDVIADRDDEGAGRARGGRRWKTISCWILVVLACLLAVLSVVVVWTRDELLDTDTFVATVTPLAQNPAIQSAVAAKISNELVSQTNLQERVKGALPPKAGFLAEPLAAQVKSVTNQLTLKLVQGPAFQKLWAASIRRSHEQLDVLLTGQKEGSITSSNGEVTVDLAQVQARIKKQLDARGITVFNKVPNARAPTLVLFRSTQLLKIQKLVKFLDKLAVFLPILTLLCFAGAIVLSADRRKWVARSAGGLALTMAVLLIAANVTRNQFLGSLLPSQPKDAAAAVIDTVSAKLLDGIRVILIVSAVVAVIAVIAGNSSLRGWLGRRRRPGWMTAGPVHGFVSGHRKGIQWGVLTLGLLVLVVWDKPTALVAIIVMLVTLALVGLVGLFAGMGRGRDDRPDPDVGPGPTPALSSSAAQG